MPFDSLLFGRKAAAIVLAATVSSAAFAHAHVASSDPAANAAAAVTADGHRMQGMYGFSVK
ncbi:hypothetical protein LMA00_12710 [Burkholderia ambifaria]|uniref:Copper resistance protein CopC n=1 Tax=Burkholderia ambifaria TaxID=152480 RepID=A0AA41JJ20_9BURK|nr:hypothetical protein [Burkholderia ambifaria]MBR8129144.1 hypothetical protein [Burkholderia ambifaria]PRD97666.1 hypothetical protein C6P77_22340 [Burkholderia ambifaria]UEP47505.1 hypothetical protein LMA00_12710 [Burkholderia ambifaria]